MTYAVNDRPAPGLGPLLELPGLDPDGVTALQDALGITGTADLELACREGLVQHAAGFDQESESALLSALVRGRAWGPTRLLDAARRSASRVLDRLQRDAWALRLSPAGAVRRMAPLCERVEIVATAHDALAVLHEFAELYFVDALLERDGHRAVVRLDDGVEVALTVAVDDAAWPALLALRTGSAAYADALVARATERGYRLDEGGLHHKDDRVPLVDEEDLFQALGLPWHPPELRETADASTPAPPDLVHMDDIRGVAGLHTRYGAGRFELSSMVDRAAQEGYRWVLVTDRFPPATPEAIEAQAAALRGLEDEDGPTLVHGAVVDVLPDGSLAAPDALLERLDVVIAAVRDVSRSQDEGERTARVCRAVAHPLVDVLAHPEDRVLLGRPAAPVRLDDVFAACRAGGVAIQVSGLPHRLDLDERHHASARAHGLQVLPAADAYDPNAIDQALYAVGTCRRGGWPAKDVLTTWTAASLRARRAR